VKTKVSHFEVKADEAAEGVFTGYASVFGNKDSYGDVVVKGAFAKSLESYKDGGAGIPCYWSHQMMSDPMLNIGVTTSAEEDDTGLKVTVALDVENNPKAAYAHRLLKEGRVNQMSFAYDVIDGGEAKGDDDESFYELRELKIHEVSVVPVGANQATEILEVKSRQLADEHTDESTVKAVVESAIADVVNTKIGRKLSADTLDKITTARDALNDLLDSPDADEEEPADEEEAVGGESPAADDEQEKAISPLLLKLKLASLEA